MLKFCGKYVLQYKKEYITYIVVGVILCVLNTILPAAIGQFINLFESEVSYSGMINFLILLFGLYVVKEIISYLSKMLYIRIQTNAAFSLNFELIEHLKRVSPIWIERTDLSYLSQRINNDANDILIFFISSVTELAFSVFSSGIILFLIFNTDIVLFEVTILLFFLYFVIYIIFKNRIYHSSYDMKEENSNFFARLQEQLEKSEFIRIHGMNDFFSGRLKKAFDVLYQAVFKQQSTVQAFSNIEELFGSLSICVLLWIGGIKILEGKMQIGYFYIISVYFNMILEYGKGIVAYGQEYQETFVSFERIGSILEIEKQSNGDIKLENVNTIKIQDLCFSYGEKNVFYNYKIELEKGKIYGLKGENGCGKSTLIKILMGLYMEEYEGEILWDGIEMRKLDMNYVREHVISVTEQEPILIADTIYNNIVLHKNVSPESVEEVVNIFGDNILKKENWSEEINEKSTNISGGEKQKIAIIRQCIKKGSLMLFDEPTSALDESGKKRFWELLVYNKSRKIIIIVSHDHDILEKCDEIIKI